MELKEMEDALVAGLAAGYKACGMTKDQYNLFIEAFTAHRSHGGR